jgi:hypothetical protein
MSAQCHKCGAVAGYGNELGHKSNCPTVANVAAIIKMMPRKRPPKHLIRTHIAGPIWTIEGPPDELLALKASKDVVSLSPSQALPSVYTGGEDDPV